MIALGLVRLQALRKNAILAAVVLTVLLSAPTAFGFSIMFFDATRQGSEVRITMSADVTLTDDVIKAIQANIDVNIRVQVKIYRVRNNMWDALVADTDIDYTISNSNIYRGYSVRSSDRHLDMIFENLDDALDELGSERTYRIVVPEDQSDEPEARYRGKCRIFLDRTTLPSVVSTTVRFKKSWKLTSGWTEFELQ